jgi:hypothetical protein
MRVRQALMVACRMVVRLGFCQTAEQSLIGEHLTQNFVNDLVYQFGVEIRCICRSASLIQLFDFNWLPRVPPTRRHIASYNIRYNNYLIL